ncbi:S8 family serine peptidase [Photorhabdus temperata]|uniref:Subtilisin-like serine protease n=2 Tax=Photorhabdus temperata TaxID=574560 RepID=A0A081RXR8_PHOTE|nr:S8 family peptidase [Photorhabdus temperata]KER03471.1 subtilisin-like serine protease [Photorhabdus temperata subsp. temperata Meg1]MCT8349018.1 S8 family serine peptidase [Photorhabdus temperata]
MSISLEYFKSAKFDGNLYLKCYGEMSDNIEIKYKLIDSDTKDIYEYYSDDNQLACFTSLKPANYTIETTIIENGKVIKKLPPENIEIKESDFLFDIDREINKIIRDESNDISYPLLKQTQSEDNIISLKGSNHIPNDNFKYNLEIMFFPDGLKRLAAEKTDSLPVFNASKHKMEIKPVFNKDDFDKKTWKTQEFNKLTYLYKIEADINHSDLVKLADELEKLDYIEYCSLTPVLKYQPPPPLLLSKTEEVIAEFDSHIITPDFSYLQGYLDEYNGMNIRNAWATGYKGQGITVHHLDFGVYRNHEDLVGNITVINSRPETQDCNHGTASTGCIAAKNNEFGVTGIAHECHFRFYDIDDFDRIIYSFSPGDIISLNIQIVANNRYYPFTYIKSNWQKIKSCVDAGAIIIFSAGNGGINLAYDFTFPNYGDPGGIMIGACTSINGYRLGFSNHNLHTSLNSWGENVTTTGYSNLQRLPGNNRNYTRSYNGTSSATPLVSGALALVQSYAKLKYHRYFNCSQIATLIKNSGFSTGELQGMGSRPNVANAFKLIDRLFS